MAKTKQTCEQCPWRKSNHGKRSPGGFYTKANVTRLWNQIRSGGRAMSCHLTDPSHPDHIIAGAPENGQTQECKGLVVLVMRELERAAGGHGGTMDDKTLKVYFAERKRGLTKRGILYWALERFQFGGVPLIGGPKLPQVDDDDSLGLPSHLEEPAQE